MSATPRIHTINILPASITSLDAHEVFRQANQVSGPAWAETPGGPETWASPSDAAGGLLIWDECGAFVRASPKVEANEDWLANTFGELCRAGAVIGTARASYASSGGRVVLLCNFADCWCITVSRREAVARQGWTEEDIRRACPQAVTHVLGGPA